PNPDIPFEDLNIEVNTKNTPLRKSKEPLYAGVSTFGFGGTNAHAIIRDVERADVVSATEQKGGLLTLSAHGDVALRSLASRYAAYLGDHSDSNIDVLAQNIERQRAHLPNMVAVRGSSPAAIGEALSAFSAGDDLNVVTQSASLASGKAEQENREVAFVFTGNGAQFAGMGRAEYDNNSAFRQHFDRISVIAEPVFGWSASEMLTAKDLGEKLESTAIAQPLLFVLQMAIVACLSKLGLSPKVSYGHSVGEVAAATCAGGLTLEQGIQVIHARSQMQETTRGQGKMAAGGISVEDAAPILADIRSKGLLIEVAAINGPNAITVSGSQEAIEMFARTIKSKELPAKVLDLDYGFHSPLMDSIESGILKKLDGLTPTKSDHIYVSTVTGKALDAATLDPDYWWQNIRKPVLFQSASEAAFDLGCRIFIEVGPRSLFRSNLNETLREQSETISALETLKQPITRNVIAAERTSDDGRHLELAALSAFAAGATRPKLDMSDVAHLELPKYPWQKRSFRADDSSESLARSSGFDNYHCLLGFSPHADAPYWRNHIDGHNIPMFRDHKVDGKIIVPGAGYVEMMLAAASEYFETDKIEIRDMDIMRAIELSDDQLMETHTEISPDSSSVRIYSRSRLSEDEWALNASARIAKIPSAEFEIEEVSTPPSGTILAEADTLYPLAKSFGLDYGPTFERADAVYFEDDDTISVSFSAAEEGAELGPYGSNLLLNPTDLDVAFHGLVALYQELEDKEIKRGYIPIRFGKLRIFKAYERAAFARIAINSFTTRSIAADFKLYNADGVLIASLQDARFRAASLVKRQKLAQYTYHFSERRHPHPTEWSVVQGPQTKIAPIAPLGDNFLDGEWIGSEPRLLLEAAAQRIAFDAAFALADNGKLSFQSLLERGKLSPDDETRLWAFLTVLENAGFAESRPKAGIWQIPEEIELPDAQAILSTVISSYPDWAAECVMLSHIASHVERDGVASVEGASAFEGATLEQYYSSSPEMVDHIDTISAFALEAIKQLPDDRPVRILEVGSSAGGLSRRLLSLLEGTNWSLVCVSSNRRANGLFSLTTTDIAQVDVLDVDAFLLECDDMAPFDLVISANGLSIEPDLERLLRAACRKMNADGRFIISESVPSNLNEVMFSFEEGWFARTVSSEFPLSRQRTAEEWDHFLSGFGLGAITVYSSDDDSLPGIVVQANASNRVDIRDNLVSMNKSDEKDGQEAPETFVNVVLGSKSFSEDCGELLASSKGSQYFTLDSENNRILDEIVDVTLSANDAVRVVDLTGFASSTKTSDPQAELEAHVCRLNDLLKRCSDRIDEIVVVAPGGMRGLYNLGATNPVQTGLWTYLRTVRNEYPDVAVKTVDMDEALATDDFLKLLTQHLLHRSVWSEAIISQDYCMELIAQTGFPSVKKLNEEIDTSQLMSTLAFEDLSGVDELDWVLVEKPEPSANEVQVEVSATGLNFRDVMWTLGILPDEALEDGFAGATLGFECAGRISAVGEGVADFKIGDPVLALGPACFSSHVTFDALSVVPLPEGIDPVAAASIPVAFLTAYYALHDLARLEQDEWVLIQGGAGGVGLAAIQIAQWRGAKIIATAGTDEKRDLLRTLGVEHVFDSRSLDFVDQVMALTGEGIDCVLNSLFGEAMERGIELLKPFGRFLELGKRDYYGNTKIGLRPFRRNISYFGIDADQLLAQKPKIAKRLFAELMALFEEEVFSPLPHRRFEGREIVDAFRLMQKSGHIGKIVVEPTSPTELGFQTQLQDVALSNDGHYVIIGGLGGFGLEVARWLADHGVRHISLMGRSGVVNEEQAAVIADFANQGVAIQPIACDAADKGALSAALDGLRSDRPIKGIIHAAMVLRDGLITNMSDTDVADVLTPKVRGAFNVDQLTRDDPLDTFLLFSSITTFIGNPGQASYVAANGYLEGLARQRRIAGLPALAVGWGAISDVGYLARNEDVKEAISTRTGTQQFTADQALNALSRLMAMDNGSMASAVLSVAPMDWEIAKGGLEILDTPSYVTMKRRASLSSQGASESFDLAALVEGKTMPEARALVSGLLAKEVSAVLRTPVEDINVKRPLTDLGMDSLMGVELRMSAQQKLGVDIPLASIANGVSIDDISSKIIEKLVGKQDISLNHTSELASVYLDDGAYEQEISSFDKLSRDE
ncbi:MAG: SDR family NAD(P)-dependent oxidoreductase, partial [Hyphomicrobiales bacterium]